MVCQRAFGREPEEHSQPCIRRGSRRLGALRCVLDEPFAFGIGEPEQGVARASSKASEIYLRKNEAEADCLYSEASIVPAHLVGSGPKDEPRSQPAA